MTTQHNFDIYKENLWLFKSCVGKYVHTRGYLSIKQQDIGTLITINLLNNKYRLSPNEYLKVFLVYKLFYIYITYTTYRQSTKKVSFIKLFEIECALFQNVWRPSLFRYF